MTAPMRPALRDQFARAITYLRVSVTDRCDLRCTYCMTERQTFVPKAQVLALEELDRLCRLFSTAGLIAAKRTSDLIPLGHALAQTSVKVEIQPDEGAPGFIIKAKVGCADQARVEMEALTAASIAALTLFDMLNAADRGMKIGLTRLIEKSGGKSGLWPATM
jgi:molybdenum cofactor biosynthesis protein MoaC